MSHQSNSFSEDAASTTAASPPLTVATQPSAASTALKFSDGALSAKQQGFNRLLTRTENLARKIEAAQRLADTHRTVHLNTLRPLEVERDGLMRDMVLWLDERLPKDGKGCEDDGKKQ
jgi:hypothetical protein